MILTRYLYRPPPVNLNQKYLTWRTAWKHKRRKPKEPTPSLNSVYHFHILVGIFIIELGLYILMMGFLKCPRSSWASKLDAHPLSFNLSFHTLIAPVHPLHGNAYSLHWHQLMGISIARWLASLTWDFLLFLSSPHNLHHQVKKKPPSSYSIPPIVLYPWLTLMYCVKVEKSLRLLKYETIPWLVIGVVHNESILVWRKWSMTKLYDFVGMNFLWPCYFERT